jgi:hypothetical protein
MDAPPPSREMQVCKTAHQQRLMGATIVLGREDDRSRDAGVVMGYVVQHSFSAQLRGVWVTYEAAST